jgi:hypothetical protein
VERVGVAKLTVETTLVALDNVVEGSGEVTSVVLVGSNIDLLETIVGIAVPVVTLVDKITDVVSGLDIIVDGSVFTTITDVDRTTNDELNVDKTV